MIAIPFFATRRALVAVLCTVVAAPGNAQPQDPKAPAGNDPGGFPVAVISAGIDYTDPVIAGRLARDGEGEVIGYDVTDNDARPFASAAAADGGTELAKRLAAIAGLRLVPVRVTVSDPVSIARGTAFATQTPARVVVVPPGEKAHLELLAQVAARAEKILFVVAPSTGAPPGPRPALPDNVLYLTTPSDQSREVKIAIEAVAVTLDRLLDCAGKAPQDETGADMKKALLAMTVAAETDSPKSLKPCPAR